MKRTPFESTGKRGPRAAVTPEYAEAVARLVAEGYSEAAAVRALSCAPSDPSQLHRWRKSVSEFRRIMEDARECKGARRSAGAAFPREDRSMTRDHAAARARRRCRPLTPAYRLAIAREVADGGSLRGVAEALRVDPSQLHRWIHGDAELRRLVRLAQFVSRERDKDGRAFHIERALFAPLRERAALLRPWLGWEPPK